MSYLYDEVFDSFENAYDDYLHGEKNFYDSSGCDITQENSAVQPDLFTETEPEHNAPAVSDSEGTEAVYEPEPYPEDNRNTLLRTIRSDELMTRCYPRRRFLVDTLLTPGLAVLAGSPKVGKSWLVLHLCMQVAKGEPFLGMNVSQGSVLYIALEDDNRRLQNRVFRITDEGSPNLHLVTECAPIGDRLDEEITDFVSKYRDTKLIVIDTFQKIREQGRELSYANDYSEVSFLKKIADYLNICILLVHHTRKQGDSDYMNEISGTNGISGSADTLMVLKKENRSSRYAVLSCTGRDIEDREMKLHLDRETCVWELKSDTLNSEDCSLPDAVTELIAYMKDIGTFEGSNTGFTERFTSARRVAVNAIQLKKLMNQYIYELQDHGVSFESTRSNKNRMLTVRYEARFDKSLSDKRDE